MAPPIELDDERLAICLDVLEAARSLAADDPRLRQLEQATAHLRKSAKKTRKKARATRARAHDRALLSNTGRWRDWDDGPREDALREGVAQETRPGGRRLHHAQHCYVCKQPYRELHHHYHRLCPSCAAHNWRARSRRADLRGRRALVTGGRVKIGFELVLKLLRDGAEVEVVTRFPRDARARFAALEGYESFAERLEVSGLDLRYLPDVLKFCEAKLARGAPLDILVNNAAQTIWRPPAWYAELAQAELQPETGDALATGATPDNFLSRFHQSCERRDEQAFPLGRRDEEGRQLDLRAQNSWVLGLEQVDAVELVEAQLVNAIAPALLTSSLRPLLDRSLAPDRHVVNVSAVEGQYAYANKTPRHPHTNMAKAALNMLTRTSAGSWAASRVYINSVDTGWITQENPEPIKRRLADTGFRPPLDCVDGAARLYDPILRGVEGRPVWGHFLKDYAPAPW